MLVRGKVRDTNGDVIPFVNILVKDSNPPRGVATDFDGNFQIDVAENTILVFSHVGTKQTIQLNVGAKNYHEIVMMNELMLDEITVTGTRTTSWNWLLIALGTFAGYKILTSEKIKKITI